MEVLLFSEVGHSSGVKRFVIGQGLNVKSAQIEMRCDWTRISFNIA